jgi:hypothetical protein
MTEEPALASKAGLELARQIHTVLLGGVTAALVDTKGQLSTHENRVVEATRKLLG